jgi:hypothetical protein
VWISIKRAKKSAGNTACISRKILAGIFFQLKISQAQPYNEIQNPQPAPLLLCSGIFLGFWYFNSGSIQCDARKPFEDIRFETPKW